MGVLEHRSQHRRFDPPLFLCDGAAADVRVPMKVLKHCHERAAIVGYTVAKPIPGELHNSIGARRDQAVDVGPQDDFKALAVFGENGAVRADFNTPYIAKARLHVFVGGNIRVAGHAECLERITCLVQKYALETICSGVDANSVVSYSEVLHKGAWTVCWNEFVLFLLEYEQIAKLQETLDVVRPAADSRCIFSSNELDGHGGKTDTEDTIICYINKHMDGCHGAINEKGGLFG